MRCTLPAAICAAVIAGSAGGQEASQRPRFDFTLGLRHLQSESTVFEGGTVVDTDSSTGVGFTFDWRFADRWSAGVSLAIHDIDYAADIALADNGGRELVRNDLDTHSVIGHVKRYFGNWARVEPYATAGLGWASIDTNIPTGPPVGLCWFDPWWGLVCDTFQPTRTMTEGAALAGVGVRWDFSRRVFLDASVGREWIDLDNAGRPDFTQLRVSFGLRNGSDD